jgi:hypothetical protein
VFRRSGEMYGASAIGQRHPVSNVSTGAVFLARARNFGCLSGVFDPSMVQTILNETTGEFLRYIYDKTPCNTTVIKALYPRDPSSVSCFGSRMLFADDSQQLVVTDTCDVGECSA